MGGGGGEVMELCRMVAGEAITGKKEGGGGGGGGTGGAEVLVVPYRVCSNSPAPPSGFRSMITTGISGRRRTLVAVSTTAVSGRSAKS